MDLKEKTIKMKNCFLIPAIVLTMAFIMVFWRETNGEAASTAPAQGKTAAAPTAQEGAPPGLSPARSSTETEVLTGTTADINGRFKVGLSVPGGTKDSIFTLTCDGSSITGNITNPFNPDEKCSIYNGKAEGNRFKFSAKISRAEYNFEGTAGKGSLSMTLITLETIPLDAGSKSRHQRKPP